ncbi:MAG: polyphosphate polymerase domain-containing protein [Clostridia bacterium]|nr:polyphosphate polymerase domain-containing protein [Clostridia bacterium]
MGNKYVFKRYELKYLLTPAQYQTVLREVASRLQTDEYGETTIQSLYYDTDTHLLIRNSIERPWYKEKIRARSYGLATPDQKVFLELKKKYEKVVYKRRISLKEGELAPFIERGISPKDGQIVKELQYVCRFYKNLRPSMLLLYDRTAYHEEGSELRITFDKNIRYRTERLDLCAGLDGTPILDGGRVMMEIKTAGAYPTWLITLLNENGLYKTSFSKYGTAYKMEEEKKRNTTEERDKEKVV